MAAATSYLEDLSFRLKSQVAYIRKESVKILTSYHLSNILISISFMVSRLTHPLCDVLYSKLSNPCAIESGEHEVLLFLAVVIFWKNRKAVTWLHYLNNVFTFTKIANTILFYRIDPRIAIIYGLVCIVLMVLFPEPVFSGPETITYFRAQSLHDELNRNKKITWMIEFYASWSPECKQIAPVIAELSQKYNLPNFRWGKLDVGRYGAEAERFRINAHPTSRQLPTLSMFQGGKETRRRPVVNQNKRAIPFIFKEEHILIDFELLNVFNECKKNLSKDEKKKMEEELQKKEA